jgi:chromosome segregation ATPase
VLEHLPDPLATVRQAATLLKSDGLFVAQTPEFREGMTFADLTARNDPFLIQLKPNEHIHLFSRKSAAMLFERAGLGHVVFEPAIFSDYDMFPLASRVALTPLEAAPATHIRSHATSPLGRTIEALLDLYGQFSELKTLAESRQKTIERQSRHINELSADYDRRLVVITQEQAKVAELSLMVEQLNGTLAALHSALAERTRQVDEKAATIDAMTRHVDQLSADYHLRGQAIAELRTSIDASLEREKQHANDAAARMQQLAERDEQIRQLAAVAERHRSRLAEQQSALDEQIRQIAALDEQLRGLGAEGEKRLAQIRTLESQLSAQGDELCRLSVDYDRRLEAITLRDGQIAEQAKTVAEQHEHIVRLSADYERRLQVIHNHEAKIAELTQYIGRQQEAMERAAAKSRSLEGKIESLRVQLVASAEELKALQSRLGVRMLSRLGLA